MCEHLGIKILKIQQLNMSIKEIQTWKAHSIHTNSCLIQEASLGVLTILTPHLCALALLCDQSPIPLMCLPLI
jgi:hypothetical protein